MNISKFLRTPHFEVQLWTAASNYDNLDNFFEKIYLVEESAILSRVNFLFLFVRSGVLLRMPYSVLAVRPTPNALLHIRVPYSLLMPYGARLGLKTLLRLVHRNHVKEISGNFKDLARVDLAVLKKIVNFWRFQNGSINLLGIAARKVCFLFPK